MFISNDLKIIFLYDKDHYSLIRKSVIYAGFNFNLIYLYFFFDRSRSLSIPVASVPLDDRRLEVKHKKKSSKKEKKKMVVKASKAVTTVS